MDESWWLCRQSPTFIMVKPMNKRSRMFLRINAVVTLLLFSHYAMAQNNVDQLTKQWLDLDKSANQLIQNWQQEKQQLTFRISLLSQQNDNIRDKISRTNNQKDQVHQQRQDILTQQTLIEQKVNEYRQALPNILDHLQQLMLSLPPQLAQQLSPEFTQAATQKELTGQYQAITNIVNKLSKNSKLIQIKRGIIELKGHDFLTEQLYFGHDQAWFITQDNSRAGVGFRKNKQWFWQEDSEHADNIRQAIVHAQNQMPGPLLNLPIYLDNK
ncbi:MAG: DNA repair exonuclease SbcCD ATPase subunit [Alteromonadaceae bacterium]|jgi:DNA repair exonuclease SbcCD ATPase subunit